MASKETKRDEDSDDPEPAEECTGRDTPTFGSLEERHQDPDSSEVDGDVAEVDLSDENDWMHPADDDEGSGYAERESDEELAGLEAEIEAAEDDSA